MGSNDPIIIGIATIKERKHMLPQVLDSLQGENTKIFVYCNDYASNSKYSNVFMYPGETDLGDAGKYWGVWQTTEPAYYFTCDDDLIYPPDYVQTMVAAIERYDRNAAVSMHGKEYYGPVNSYYGDINAQCADGRAKAYHCLHPQPQDAPVTVLGTGCAAWHSSLVDLSIEDFPVPNMADIWFSKKLNSAGVPRYAIAHEPLEYIEPPKGSTIWEKHNNNDAIQTAVFNSVNWML